MTKDRLFIFWYFYLFFIYYYKEVITQEKVISCTGKPEFTIFAFESKK